MIRLDALFYEYNVDLILESGSNIYERTYPVVKTLRKFQTDYKSVEMPVIISLPKYSIGSNRKITGLITFFLKIYLKDYKTSIG